MIGEKKTITKIMQINFVKINLKNQTLFKSILWVLCVLGTLSKLSASYVEMSMNKKFPKVHSVEKYIFFVRLFGSFLSKKS